MADPTLHSLPSPGDPGALTRLRGLLEAASAVRAGGDLQPLLEGIARVISVSLGFGTVVVNLHRPAWDDFEVVVVHGADEEARRILLGTRQTWTGWQPLLDPRFERAGAYLVPHDQFDWDHDATVSYVPPGGRSRDAGDWHPEDALFVPLRSSTGHLVGIVSVDEPLDGRRPTDAQLEVLTAVAGHAALAIEHAQAAADGDRNRAAVQHLLRVSARLTTRRSVEDMLAAVCEGINEALGFRRVIVALTEGPDLRLTVRASIGWTTGELAGLRDQLHLFEHLVDEFVGLGDAVGPSQQVEVFDDAEVGEEVKIIDHGRHVPSDVRRRLRHLVPADRDGAVVRPIRADQTAQQRRLAGAVAPGQRDCFARTHLEVELVDDRVGSEGTAETAHLEDGRAFGHGCDSASFRKRILTGLSHYPHSACLSGPVGVSRGDFSPDVEGNHPREI